MKLETARRLLLQDIASPGSVDIGDLNKAEAIGADAIELLPWLRSQLYVLSSTKLSGETDE